MKSNQVKKIAAIAAEVQAQPTMAKKAMRSAYGIVEIMLGIVIVAVLVGGAYIAFQKVYVPAQADKEVKKVTLVISALERVKSHNADAYPAFSGGLTTNSIVLNSMGGANSARDVISWQYACAAGGDQTITLTPVQYDSVEKRDLVLNDLQNTIRPWTVAASGTNGIVISKQHAVCN